MKKEKEKVGYQSIYEACERILWKLLVYESLKLF
jgi:hypothetical protein